ncbi:hypothetical protein SLEP1_g28990 [Rubroshorea leprosula]|uniref:Uncharacterized protein n=1 Tax=Rubroshorea leprosula TaxID=152421 RepID=A0AAV5K5Y3_9ROSI|nr:hypothetical protein SLEP1_g28990 [Rubroshorea leprosula]
MGELFNDGNNIWVFLSHQFVSSKLSASGFDSGQFANITEEGNKLGKWKGKRYWEEMEGNGGG